MSIGEFELISKYFALKQQSVKGMSDPILKQGIGDDAAVLQGLGNQSLTISVDTLVEGVHFPEYADPYLLAKRALRVNLSDMAAMGALPKWFTLALTLPEVDEAWLDRFSMGLLEDAEHFGCSLIGGDTTKGPLNIGLQIMGTVDLDRKPILRSGAKPGDVLVVSGSLGDAGAALSSDLNQYFEATDVDARLDSENTEAHFLQRYWLPTPRVDLAYQASHLIHAACDISDGLLADVGHIAASSELMASVHLEQVPVSRALSDRFDCPRYHAVTAGDDYELCMAVAPNSVAELISIGESLGVAVTKIGEFAAGEHQGKVRVLDSSGIEVNLPKKGYAHF